MVELGVRLDQAILDLQQRLVESGQVHQLLLYQVRELFIFVTRVALKRLRLEGHADVMLQVIQLMQVEVNVRLLELLLAK
jgi:hypothetical protein